MCGVQMKHSPLCQDLISKPTTQCQSFSRNELNSTLSTPNSWLSTQYPPKCASQRIIPELALDGIIGGLVPERAVLCARARKLSNLVVGAGPSRARVGAENARLDDLGRLGVVLAVADVVVARAAVCGETLGVAVLRALWHEGRVVGLCLDAAEVDLFSGGRLEPDYGGCDGCASYG